MRTTNVTIFLIEVIMGVLRPKRIVGVCYLFREVYRLKEERTTTGRQPSLFPLD